MRDSCLWCLRCPLQALGVRKVALLFLTKTDLPHELIWRLWLEGAAGQLPQQHLQAAQARPGLPLPAHEVQLHCERLHESAIFPPARDRPGTVKSPSCGTPSCWPLQSCRKRHVRQIQQLGTA